MTSKLVTHKDIHAHLQSLGLDINLPVIIVWGQKGVFGEPVIAFPKHYPERPAFKAAEEKAATDARFKLSDEDVKDVLRRVDEGETQASIAADYGVDPSTISLIVRNKRRTNSK